MRFTGLLLGAALVLSSLLVAQTPASATHGSLSGKVTDLFGTPLNNVCVTIGPPVRCVTMTKADGTWFVDLAGAPDGLTWDVRFLIGGQIRKEFLGVVVNGPTVLNAQIGADGFRPPTVLAGGRCASSTGGVEQRIASFWACVDGLGSADVLTADDVGGWARNVIERDPA